MMEIAPLATKKMMRTRSAPSQEENDAYFESLLDRPIEGLILPAEDGVPNVDFAFADGSGRECRLWEGYFDASSLLLNQILRSPNSPALIFPAMFNLRHAIEVALKWHIRYAGGAVPKGAGHNFSVLIGAFRETAENLDEEATYVDEGLFDLVFELAAVDPRSTAFRYSAEHDGSPIMMSDKPWDLRLLIWAVDFLSIYFDHLSGYIDMSDPEYQALLRGT